MSSKGLPKAADKVGEWTLVESIDSGGNADVWRASRVDHPDVAIKILRNLGREPCGRFRNEVRALRKLGELAGIMPMLDVGLPDGKGHPWYAMPLAISSAEFLRGKDRKAIVSEFVRLGETLSVLHGKKIAHRDIKPQNLLGWNGRLCFSDFGLVKYPDLAPITRPAGMSEPNSLWRPRCEEKRQEQMAFQPTCSPLQRRYGFFLRGNRWGSMDPMSSHRAWA